MLSKYQTESKFNSIPIAKRITQNLKLSMTLRWLAGGDHKDISDMHGVSADNYFYTLARETVRRINKEPELDLPLMRIDGRPDLISCPELLAPSIRQFNLRSGGIFTACAAALDGIAVKIECPSFNGSAYYCRKGFHSFNVSPVQLV